MIKHPKFFLTVARLALGAGLLSAVADRLGWWGAPGQSHVIWGNWDNFVAYTRQVNSFLPSDLAPLLALLATLAEVVIGSGLVLGIKTRQAAWGASLLTLAFALAMTISFGPKSALDSSVWANVVAGLLLAQNSYYPYTVDAWRQASGPRPSVMF